MRQTSRTILASLSAMLLALPATPSAMEIRQFDKLAGGDQIEFVDRLAASVQDASQGQLAARVRYFFEPKHPGEDISGMGRFELNLALARIADLDAAAKQPGIRRLEVEDVMYMTLEASGLKLQASFRPSAIGFRAKLPPAKFVMDKAHAQRALDETQAWLASQRFRDRRMAELSGFSSNEKAIAFFAALMALAVAADKAGIGKGAGSPGYDSGSGPPKTWWESSGYTSYHDAVRSICLSNTTAANPTWC